jgi:hypothetical protein
VPVNARAKAKVMPSMKQLRIGTMRRSEVMNRSDVKGLNMRSLGHGSGVVARHSVSPVVRPGLGLRHSGRAVFAVGLMAVAVAAQEVRLELDLRSGKQLVASSLSGSPETGFAAKVGSRSERVLANDLLSVRVTGARAPKLLRVELVGGDVVHGAIAGGDKDGDFLELLSPILGKIALPIDRLAALVQHGVHASDQILPKDVDEGIYLRTGHGYDLVAGTLHRFGSRGISFQPSAAAGPVWFSPRKFSSLRLRGGEDREALAPMTLLTRAADRLGVTLKACSEQGLDVVIDSGSTVHLRWADVACLSFEKDVMHLSAMKPSQVVESGFEGDVVHAWRRDHSVVGGELLAHGRAYGRGLGVHSRSRLSFEVPAGATHFRTRVALDDSVAELPIKAHVEVRVLLGNKLLFESSDLKFGQVPLDAGLHAVKAGATITLEVDFGRGRDLGDRINWLLPMFLMRSQS